MWSVYGNSHIWDVDERNLESVSLGRTAASARAYRNGFVDVDANAALAGWMHRVCADLAGCYEHSVLSMVRLGWCVA